MGVHLFQTFGFFPFHNDSNTNIALIHACKLEHPHSTKTAAHNTQRDRGFLWAGSNDYGIVGNLGYESIFGEKCSLSRSCLLKNLSAKP